MVPCCSPLLVAAILCFSSVQAFTNPSLTSSISRSQAFQHAAASSSDWDDQLRLLQKVQEEQKNAAIVDALIMADASEGSSKFNVYFSGTCSLPLSTKKRSEERADGADGADKSEADAPEERPTANEAKRKQYQQLLVLTSEKILGQKSSDSDRTFPSLLAPITSKNRELKLLLFALQNKPLSKSVMLGLNTILINRDGGLFDNLPWSSWSVDPQMRNRDAAGNPIEAKYHPGKRDAYNRFMGKDWQGRSLAIGNMALRLKYMMDEDEDSDKGVNENENASDEDSQKALAERILQLRLREIQMDIAQTESDLAVARMAQDDIRTSHLEMDRADLEGELIGIQEDLKNLIEEPSASKSLLDDVLARIADWTTESGANEAPYRGAIGYAPTLDSKEDIDGSHVPYTGPYDMLKDILKEQLNAKVIGCVIENTSLLRGNVALGGAVILQRIIARKEVTIDGNTFTTDDSEEEFGNDGISGGSAIVVECGVDEAIGMSITYGVPLRVESQELLDRSSLPVTIASRGAADHQHIWEIIPTWKPLNQDLTLQVEGVRGDDAENESPISIPRTTASLYGGSLLSDNNSQDGRNKPMFPTDDPIQTLDQYDGLSNEDKAKTLLEMSNFRGSLPRPRVIRTSPTNPLDELLLPLINESVRNQYQIREAERRGDVKLAEQLRNSRSKLQLVKEKAQEARDQGLDDQAERWEQEADFLKSLRADSSQDEGSYSGFLDRDDWYERNRQSIAKRVKRSSFGTLLDGFE